MFLQSASGLPFHLTSLEGVAFGAAFGRLKRPTVLVSGQQHPMVSLFTLQAGSQVRMFLQSGWLSQMIKWLVNQLLGWLVTVGWLVVFLPKWLKQKHFGPVASLRSKALRAIWRPRTSSKKCALERSIPSGPWLWPWPKWFESFT